MIVLLAQTIKVWKLKIYNKELKIAIPKDLTNQKKNNWKKHQTKRRNRGKSYIAAGPIRYDARFKRKNGVITSIIAMRTTTADWRKKCVFKCGESNQGNTKII